MKNRWHIVPVFMAMLLLLGHQLVPHLHSEVVDEPSVYAVEAIETDWLGRIFGLDQGADHLEHFRKANSQEWQPVISFLVLPTPWPAATVGNGHLKHRFAPFTDGAVPIPGDRYYAVGVQRGPPQG